MAKFPKEALVGGIFFGDDCEEYGLRFVEERETIVEGKCAYTPFVFEHEGKFYEITSGREGSYFSGYYFEHSDWPDMVECEEVEKVAVVTYVWKPVERKEAK